MYELAAVGYYAGYNVVDISDLILPSYDAGIEYVESNALPVINLTREE